MSTEDNIDGPVCSRCHSDELNPFHMLHLIDGKWFCTECLQARYQEEEKEQDI